MRNVTFTPYDLMQMHVQALYSHDNQSRLVVINDGGGRHIAPRFFLGRTEQGHLWRFRHDLSEELCHDLQALCQTEPLTLSERPKHEADYVQILAAHQPVEKRWFGPAYWFPNGAAPAPEPIFITEQTSHLLQNGLPEWIPDVPSQQPFVAVIVDGQAVAVCASVHITDAAHEAGVETLAAHRRQGCAVAVVSTWASAVEKMGALPLYSTSVENVASQKVAARLGLSQYGADFHVT
jgi:RimJ/RimL family protein N-acetyltransferase